jgi:hypothetical protein
MVEAPGSSQRAQYGPGCYRRKEIQLPDEEGTRQKRVTAYSGTMMNRNDSSELA